MPSHAHRTHGALATGEGATETLSMSRAQHAINEEHARRWSRRPVAVETVLLLDPDAQAGQRIVDDIAEMGVSILLETEPFRAIARAGTGGVDLLIASAGLGRDRLATLVAVVRQEMSIPVLLAHGAADTDLIGPAVLAGARPVIALPYDAREMARVLRAALPAAPQADLIRIADLRIRPDSFDVSFGDRSIDLSPLEFALLVILSREVDRAISRRSLTRALWADSDPVNADDLLGAAVSRIRRKLKPLGIEEAVHTVRGFGYRLDGSLLRRSEQTTPQSG